MTRAIAILVPPALCVALLGGIVAQNRGHVRPADAEDYHRRARAAVESIPYRLGSFIGRDEEIAGAAVTLLRPNASLSRTYVSTQTEGPGREGRFGLLVIQTRESRNMQGHYPPNCYVSSGMAKAGEKQHTWQIAGMTVPLTEYDFTQRLQDQVVHSIVYNFLIVPGKIGIVADMQGVDDAAEDYQQRYFGAAQFQVLFSSVLGAEQPQDQRDQIVKDLVAANTSVIQALLAGGIQ